MKAYGFAFAGKEFGKLVVFASRAEAESFGNGFTIASKEEELFAYSSITLQTMVDFYNHHNKAIPVKKFSDRQTAAKRLLALAIARAEPPTTSQEKKVTETKNTTGKRGRANSFSHKRLKIVGSNDNTRRKDSWGYKSLQIIIDNPGISFEDFLAAGGRAVDLRWDINHARVIAE